MYTELFNKLLLLFPLSSLRWFQKANIRKSGAMKMQKMGKNTKIPLLPRRRRGEKITAHSDEHFYFPFSRAKFMACNEGPRINELFTLRLFPSFSFWLTINTYSFISSFHIHSRSRSAQQHTGWKHIHTTPPERSGCVIKGKIVIYCISFRN